MNLLSKTLQIEDIFLQVSKNNKKVFITFLLKFPY